MAKGVAAPNVAIAIEIAATAVAIKKAPSMNLLIEKNPLGSRYITGVFAK
jgi:hypothetical protein